MPTNLEFNINLNDLVNDDDFYSKVKSRPNFNSLLNKLTLEDNIDNAEYDEESEEPTIIASNLSLCFETFTRLRSLTYNTLFSSNEVIDEVAHFISVSSTLKKLNIVASDTEGIDHFFSVVLTNGHIEKVELDLNEFTLDQILPLFLALSRLPKLRKFKLIGKPDRSQQRAITDSIFNGLKDIAINQPHLSDLVVECVSFKSDELVEIFKVLPPLMNKVVLICDPTDRDVNGIVHRQLFMFPYIEHLRIDNLNPVQEFVNRLLPKFTPLERSYLTTFFPFNWDIRTWGFLPLITDENYKSSVFDWTTIQKIRNHYIAEDLFSRYSKARQVGKFFLDKNHPNLFLETLFGLKNVITRRLDNYFIQLTNNNVRVTSVRLTSNEKYLFPDPYYPLNLFPYLHDFIIEGMFFQERFELNFSHAMHTLQSLRKLELIQTKVPWDIMSQVLKTCIQLEEVTLVPAISMNDESQDVKQLASLTKSMNNLKTLAIISYQFYGKWPVKYQSFLSSSLQHLNVTLSASADIPIDDAKWWKTLYPNLQSIEANPIIEYNYQDISSISSQKQQQSLVPLSLPHQKVNYTTGSTKTIYMKGILVPLPQIWTSLDISFVQTPTLGVLPNGNPSLMLSISNSRIQNLSSLRSLNFSHITLKNINLTVRLFAQIFAGKDYPNLVHLDISNNPTFGTLGIRSEPFLRLGPTLTFLDISGCCIGSEQLSQFLPRFGHLETLSLARNSLSDSVDTFVLTTYLRNNPLLTTLNINQCFININPILDLLSHPPFTLLSLQANSIYGTHFDPTLLSTLITTNTHIQELSLIHISPKLDELEAMFSQINSTSLHHLFFVQKRNLIQIRNKEKNEIPSTLETTQQIKRVRS